MEYLFDFKADAVITLNCQRTNKKNLFDFGSHSKANSFFSCIVRFSVVLSRPYATVQLQYSHSKKKLHLHTIKLCSLSLLIRSDPSYCSLGSDAGFVSDQPNKQRKKRNLSKNHIMENFYVFDALRPKPFLLNP